MSIACRGHECIKTIQGRHSLSVISLKPLEENLHMLGEASRLAAASRCWLEFNWLSIILQPLADIPNNTNALITKSLMHMRNVSILISTNNDF